ncbi:sarcosine oxidase subunit gamma [Niveispirillum fermenti]|uniref:sarcosine oxidase subunit gamma n=1 Tax=Niveispirillum fermenti TaxID=1233113 RepID=UPI003A87F349
MVDTVRITERPDLSVASILARRGATTAAIGGAIGIDMPLGPTWVAAERFIMMGTGPGSWLAVGHDDGSDGCGDLGDRLTGLASVSDQTGAYRLFRVEGPDARTLLQRGAYIDLDGVAFPAGAVGVTMIGHVDVIIRNITDGHCYEVAVYRSYTDSFMRWADAACAGL